MGRRRSGAKSRTRAALSMRLEQLVDAPARDLAAGRDPDAVGRLHVLNDGAQRLCASGTAGNIGVELERQ